MLSSMSYQQHNGISSSTRPTSVVVAFSPFASVVVAVDAVVVGRCTQSVCGLNLAVIAANRTALIALGSDGA